MADFTYGTGLTMNNKKLKVAVVTPSIIGKLFKLVEDSIVISDVDEGEVHLPSENRFHPPLKDGHKYDVDGTKIAAVEAKALANTQADAKRNRDVAVLKGKDRENLIVDVISSTKDLNENVGMLYHAPQAVVLVEALAILAGAAPDPSLVSNNMPAEKFNRLKTPSSFKASLYQVASSMCDAFRMADFSMMTIKAQLIDLPDYFIATLEVTGENSDANTQKIMKRTTDKITQASERCVEMAKKASHAFTEVILDIDELCQAAIAAKATNETALHELTKLRVELDEKKQTLQQAESELKQQHEETRERAEEALKEYKDQVKSSGDFGKMFLAVLMDGLIDTVKTAALMQPKTLDDLAEKTPQLPKTENSSSTMRYAIESSLLQMLEKITQALAQPAELSDETINEYTLSLKNLEKYSPITDEGKELYKQAIIVREFLNKERSKLKDPSLKGKVDELRVFVGNVITAAKTVREERKTKGTETVAKSSFADKLVQAEKNKLDATRSHYSEESRREEALRKELKGNQIELSNLLAKLQNMNLEKVNFNEIISYLREGIQYLGKVKENWSQLVRFFDAILIIVETNLKGNIDTFVLEAKDPTSRRLMCQSTLKATGYCIQVGNCAQIYTQVSSKYVLPTISGIGKQFALTQSEARTKKAEIQNMLEASVQGVQQLIDDERTKFAERFEEQMDAYADSYALCITKNQ